MTRNLWSRGFILPGLRGRFSRRGCPSRRMQYMILFVVPESPRAFDPHSTPPPARLLIRLREPAIQSPQDQVSDPPIIDSQKEDGHQEEHPSLEDRDEPADHRQYEADRGQDVAKNPSLCSFHEGLRTPSDRWASARADRFLYLRRVGQGNGRIHTAHFFPKILRDTTVPSCHARTRRSLAGSGPLDLPARGVQGRHGPTPGTLSVRLRMQYRGAFQGSRVFASGS